MDKILRMKLKQWKENADELARFAEMNEKKNNRILELLTIMLDRYDDDKMSIIRRNLKRWKNNTDEMTRENTRKKLAI